MRYVISLIAYEYKEDEDAKDIPWTVKWISLAAVMVMPMGKLILGRVSLSCRYELGKLGFGTAKEYFTK
jgi:hypothetical protein